MQQVTVGEVLRDGEATVRAALERRGIIVDDYSVKGCGCGKHTLLMVSANYASKIDIVTIHAGINSVLDADHLNKLHDMLASLPDKLAEEDQMSLEDIIAAAQNQPVGILLIYTQSGGVQPWSDFVTNGNIHLN